MFPIFLFINPPFLCLTFPQAYQLLLSEKDSLAKTNGWEWKDRDHEARGYLIW